MTSDPRLSVQDVAARTGFESDAIYRAIQRGELQASKLCGRIRVSEDDLEAWITGGRVAPKPATSGQRVRPAGRTPRGQRPSYRELARQERERRER